MAQLPAECLNEILEYLEEDRLTLHSCLLVSRLWCKISVRILWRDIWNSGRFYKQHVASSILSTIIACLSNESKELLNRNEIFILTPTSKSPLFNYAAFCKVLSINGIIRIVRNILRNMPAINTLNDKNNVVANEVIKLFTSQISSLKKLTYYHNSYYHLDIPFPYFPGASDLLELCCASNLPTNFFYQLSQICHNLRSIFIEFHNNDVSNELKELISSQNNLKTLALSSFDGSWADIIPVIVKHSHTITKLQLYGDTEELPFSFVSLFSNLQEFIFSFYNGTDFEDFRMLQYVNFSKLQVLKIPYKCPKPEYVMKFLENNGRNLKKFYLYENDKALSLSIAKFCPKLKSLFVEPNNGEIDILKTIFISCQYLEIIKIRCGEKFLTEKEVFETVASHSPNSFCELGIYNSSNSNISSEDLESFFINWDNRVSKKLLSLVVVIEDCCDNLLSDYENMDIIEKYENLGIVKLTTIEYEKEMVDDDLDYYYY